MHSNQILQQVSFEIDVFDNNPLFDKNHFFKKKIGFTSEYSEDL
jgi:hypothetical protein